VVVQYHPAPHLSTAFQVTERSTRLVERPCLKRDRRHLAGLNEGEEFAQIVESSDIGTFEGHHLEREEHGRDRVGAAVKPDHDELPALAQDFDAELHRLGRANEVDRRCGTAAGRLHHLFDGVGCGIVNGGDGAHLAGLRALLRVDVDDDQLA
jgi:hypothetical protein